MRCLSILVCAWGALVTGVAYAAPKPPGFASPPEVSRASSELIDTAPQSRAQIGWRSMVGGDDQFFAVRWAHAFDAAFHLKVAEGWALSLEAPFGVAQPGLLANDEAVFGNPSLGVQYGGHVALSKTSPTWLLLGFGVDVHAPVVPEEERPGAPTQLALVRNAAPQKFLPAFFSVRSRVHAGLMYGPLRFRGEVHLTQGVFVEGGTGYAALNTYLLEVGYEPASFVELFVQSILTRQVAGVGDISPPYTLAPGVSIRFTDAISLALSTAFNFEDVTAIIFGLDFGALYEPPTRRPGYLGDDW